MNFKKSHKINWRDATVTIEAHASNDMALKYEKISDEQGRIGLEAEWENWTEAQAW